MWANVPGAALGHWVRRLHDRTAGNSEFHGLMKNQEVQETRFEIQYSQVGAWLTQYGQQDAARLGTISRRLGNRLLREGRCVIMGDLWPRSVLVDKQQLWLIDWEFAHYGDPIQDVAHLAAHCWMQFHRGKTELQRRRWRRFWQQFMAAYGTLAESDRRDAAVHIGAEILTRAIGAFRFNYLYSGDGVQQEILDEAVSFAAHAIDKLSLDAFDVGGEAWLIGGRAGE